MKKLISILAAVSILSAFPTAGVHAVDGYDLGLQTLAYSLGASTDYLSVYDRAYYGVTVDRMNYLEYTYQTIIPIESITPFTSDLAQYSDTSLGISLIEVLSHNGLISPQDISEKASSLSSVAESTEVNNLIGGYQNILKNKEFSSLMNYTFQQTTAEEKVSILAETAEQCMKDGKYFLIMYGSYNESQTEIEKYSSLGAKTRKVHSAVGIGITDGSWSFNGKSYDKCVLTLDSLNIDSNGKGAFSEDTCIYINSKTNDCYVPKFSDTLENELHIISVADDSLLNYNGPINPSKSFKTDVSDIHEISVTNKNSYSVYEMTYTGDDGEEVVMNKDNNYLVNFHNSYNGDFFIKSSNIHIDRYVGWDNPDDIRVNDVDKDVTFSVDKSNNTLDIENNVYTLTRTYDTEWNYYEEDSPLKWSCLFSFNNNSPSGFSKWDFYGETMGSVSFEPADNGVIFRGEAQIILGREDNDEENTAFYVTADTPVLVTLDKNDNIKFLSDLNNDGAYEHEVEKGDVNCDGYINASDASEILNAYAALSSNGTTYVNREIGDYDGSGSVDAADASAVLGEYAKRSTS